MAAISMACVSSQCLSISSKLHNLSFSSTQFPNSSLKPLTFSANLSQPLFSQGKIYDFFIVSCLLFPTSSFLTFVLFWFLIVGFYGVFHVGFNLVILYRFDVIGLEFQEILGPFFFLSDVNV